MQKAIQKAYEKAYRKAHEKEYYRRLAKGDDSREARIYADMKAKDIADAVASEVKYNY